MAAITSPTLSSASLMFSIEFAYENRRYPCPAGPNAVPGSVATPASLSKRSASSYEVLPIFVTFGKT